MLGYVASVSWDSRERPELAPRAPLLEEKATSFGGALWTDAADFLFGGGGLRQYSGRCSSSS